MEIILILFIIIALYLVFYSKECTKYGCSPCQTLSEKFQQLVVASDPNATGWIYVGDIYSQKAGTTHKLMLEKYQNPFQPTEHKYRGVDVPRKLFIPIDTNNRELKDGQLISIQGYEDSNPFLVELTKTMKYQYNLASY